MAFQNPFMKQRQRNILAPTSFNQEGPSKPKLNANFDYDDPDPYQPPKQRGYEDDIMDMMKESNPGAEAYKDYLSRMPEREDYKPGVMTRIAAALSGGAAGMRDPGAGVKTAMDVNSSNYRSALSDYANEGVGLKEHAGMEQDDRDTRLRSLQNARAMGLKYDEFDLKRREAGNKNAIDLQNSESGRIRADAYAKAQGKPRHQYRDQQDGSILEINEDTGQQRIIPGKNVAAGQLGVSQRNAAVGEQNAGTNAARAGTAGLAQTETGRHNLVMEGRPTAGTYVPPGQQRDARTLALEEFSTIPEYAEFIEQDKNLPIGLKPEPTQGTFESDEDFQERLENYQALIDDLEKRQGGILTRKR